VQDDVGLPSDVANDHRTAVNDGKGPVATIYGVPTCPASCGRGVRAASLKLPWMSARAATARYGCWRGDARLGQIDSAWNTAPDSRRRRWSHSAVDL